MIYRESTDLISNKIWSIFLSIMRIKFLIYMTHRVFIKPKTREEEGITKLKNITVNSDTIIIRIQVSCEFKVYVLSLGAASSAM